MFAGGSSGSVYAAVKKYFKESPLDNTDKTIHVVIIFPDRGERYVSTIYNGEWCTKVLEQCECDMEEL